MLPWTRQHLVWERRWLRMIAWWLHPRWLCSGMDQRWSLGALWKNKVIKHSCLVWLSVKKRSAAALPLASADQQHRRLRHFFITNWWWTVILAVCHYMLMTPFIKACYKAGPLSVMTTGGRFIQKLFSMLSWHIFGLIVQLYGLWLQTLHWESVFSERKGLLLD